MSEESAVNRVVLIDRIPKTFIDVMYADAEGGYVAIADDERIRELRAEGIAVAVVYEDSNQYAGEMHEKSREEAESLVRTRKLRAISQLRADEQERFQRKGG
jgi:hypothetical protein